jgi:transcriptional regulator GlxA family with amidase domain
VTNRNVGIFIFDGVEALDFTGPFEVFSVANELNEFSCFDTFTFAERGGVVETVNGLQVLPKYHFDNLPPIDILVIPGGEGTHELVQNENVLHKLAKLFLESECIMTVCSGAMLAAKNGWLDHKVYTTHRLTFPVIRQLAPSALGMPNLRYVAAGKLFTSGGISAGIDLSLALVEKLHTKKMAQRTADYLEYRWLRIPEFFANKI